MAPERALPKMAQSGDLAGGKNRTERGSPPRWQLPLLQAHLGLLHRNSPHLAGNTSAEGLSPLWGTVSSSWGDSTAKD